MERGREREGRSERGECNCSCYILTGFKFLVQKKVKVEFVVTPLSVNAYSMPCSNNNVMQPILTHV